MNELFAKLPDLEPHINLSNSTLNHFYTTLNDVKDKLNHGNYRNACESLDFLNEFPHHLRIPTSDFLDPEIEHHILHSGGFYQQFHVIVQEREFTIYLYFPASDNSQRAQIIDYFEDCINKIHLWLHFIVPNIKGDCSKKSTFYLLLTHFTKVLPSHNSPITYKHVNSAFTTSCSPETSIYIFRQEEWFKVLLHECFHCFGFDFSHYNNFEVEDKIKKVFKVDNDLGIRVYEAYVELWAEVLNIIFVSFLKTKDKKSYLFLVEHLLNKELSFTLFQCNKILNHLKFSYNQINNAKCDSVVYKETCNLTAYYFLKAVLFADLRKFESWCKKHNAGLFVFKKENMLTFVDFIIEHSKTTNLMKSMKKLDLFYRRVRLPKSAKNTMKMTIVN